MKIKRKYRLYANYKNGGYLRVFDFVDYPGLSSSIRKFSAASKVTQVFYYTKELGDSQIDIKTFETFDEALEVWKKESGML